jgi:hypothetical protein
LNFQMGGIYGSEAVKEKIASRAVATARLVRHLSSSRCAL